MPDRLLLVHGMGFHDDQWARKGIDVLESAYASFPQLAQIPFGTRFRPHAITYDSVFRTLVERWSADAKALGKPDPGASDQLVQDMTAWLREAGQTQGNFAWTHAADVVLYRLFPSVRDAVKVHVAAQIVAIANSLSATENWSVLAHSLGTAVVHDTLHAMWTSSLPGGQPTGFAANQERALVIAQIANVSRVLQTRPPVYRSTVKPGGGSKPTGCLYFLTTHHKLDPFPKPAPFEPVAWPTQTAESRGIYHLATPDHVHDWNVHAFEHYLVNPDVHVPLFRMLLDDSSVITSAEELEARRTFKPFGEIGKTAALEVKSWLEDRAAAQSWEQLSAVWEWYRKGESLFT